nr:guanylate kinase [Thermoleophilum album]
MTGPSGVGKGTLIKALRERIPGIHVAVSATTRPPRPGEVDGRDYFFLSPEEFERRVRAGEFAEHAVYAGHRYGTLLSELERPARLIVLEIDVQGARQIRQLRPDALQVFIAPPSLDELERRLRARGADDEEQIRRRLEVAKRELSARDEFAKVIVNERLDDALSELERVIGNMLAGSGPDGERAETHRPEQQSQG